MHNLSGVRSELDACFSMQLALVCSGQYRVAFMTSTAKITCSIMFPGGSGLSG